MGKRRGRLIAGFAALIIAGAVALIVAQRGESGNAVIIVAPTSPPTHATNIAPAPPPTPATYGGVAPPLHLGLDAYRYWDKLSYLEVGDRIWGQTSADPGGSNADASHPQRQLSDGETVLFEQTGPAVVAFMRMQENYGQPWNLYLDGNLIAGANTADLGQINPSSFPARTMPYPLSINPSQSQGSSIVAAAIPFQQSMMWTALHANGNFYALYRKLPYGTPLTTWSGNEPVGDVVSLLRQAGSDIAPTNIYSQSGSVNVGSSETTIANLSGPSQIRALKFHVPYAEMANFGNARLRIYWDGESSPSVDAPLKFVVGDGAGVYQPAGRALVQGWAANAGGDGSSYMDFNLYWPMPFTATARIALTAVTTTTISNVGWSVRYEPFTDPPGWWGKFHASYTNVPQPVNGQDMTFLDVSGSGKVVGTVVNFTAPDHTLEGDPHFFIDDNNTPQIQVTGSEEWGMGGNYWNGGVQTSLPLGGLPSSVNNPPGANVDGAALYRFLIADAIPFNRHMVLRWEHGGRDEVNDHPYRAVVLWYGTPVQTAILSDDFAIADSDSRAVHHYESPSQSDYTLTAAYEYPVHSAATSDTGITMTTVSTFTMALDPNNVGAFLRRKFDSAIANQRANLYVDGQFAGVWYTAGASNRTDSDGHARRWREEEFPLPAAMTTGKSAVTIRVEFVATSDPPNTTWSEFHYQMYSFVMPPDSVPLTPIPTPTAMNTNTPPPHATSTPTVTGTPPTSTPSSTAAPIPSATPILSLTPTDCANPFVDTNGNVFYGSIHALNCSGVVNGVDTAHFGPGLPATRAQFAKMLTLGFGWTLITPVAPTFSDVPPSYYAYPYIETGVAHAAISGLDAYTCAVRGQFYPCFAPNDTINRAQVAKLVVMARGLPISTPASGATFADVPPAYWGYLFVETAYANQVVIGVDIDHFAPTREVRRDELCRILWVGIGHQ